MLEKVKRNRSLYRYHLKHPGMSYTSLGKIFTHQHNGKVVPLTIAAISHIIKREQNKYKGDNLMKLNIELVPETSWFKNLRNSMSRPDWDRVRMETYKKSDNKCAICGASGRLNCHEIWSYDDKNAIQSLEGFIALCDMCHHIKHIGYAGILADEDKLDMNAVIDHFIKINGVDRKTFVDHRTDAFALWSRRSAHDWKIEFGEYKTLIKATGV